MGADLRDYFVCVLHEMLNDLVVKRVCDGEVLKLIRQVYVGSGQQRPIQLGRHLKAVNQSAYK